MGQAVQGKMNPVNYSLGKKAYLINRSIEK